MSSLLEMSVGTMKTNDNIFTPEHVGALAWVASREGIVNLQLVLKDGSNKGKRDHHLRTPELCQGSVEQWFGA